MNAATGCSHAALCLAAGRYCGVMLWGPWGTIPMHLLCYQGELVFPFCFPGREHCLREPAGSPWDLLSAHSGQLHILPVLLHSPISALLLGRPILFPCMAVPAAGKGHWAALHTPALCFQPGTSHLPASPGLVLASLSSLQLCCSMSGTRVHCLHPLHKPCCRRTGSPISQLQPRANTQKLGMDGRTPISRLFPSTGPCSQHHQCDHNQGMQLPRSQRPAQLLS